LGAPPKTAAVLRRALAYASRYLQPCGSAWVCKHSRYASQLRAFQAAYGGGLRTSCAPAASVTIVSAGTLCPTWRKTKNNFSHPILVESVYFELSQLNL
jgi:hypothetical protein